MKQWTRARFAQHCGLCGALVSTGDALAVYELPRAGRPLRFVRCGDCEGGAPPDLPAHIETRPPPLDLTRFGVLPLDFSGRRLGEREPGEDDQ